MSQSNRIPRYTSYPIYPKWNNELVKADFFEQVKQVSELDLYIHIPFCAKPCFYCGCNRIVAAKGRYEKKYVQNLKDEWSLYTDLNHEMNIKSIHFGGGTPTFLNAELLDDLLSYILEARRINKLSVEVDPRITTTDQIDIFLKHGLSRVSMGIQDFSQDVQEVINRVQPVKMVMDLTEYLRLQGITDINFDLIYGLPKQDKASIDYTFEHIQKIKPSTISLFAYAHVPKMFKLQNRLTKFLPGNKNELYVYYKKRLLNMGYEQIGLDHFVTRKSLLWKDYKNKTMGRNFMGYTSEKAMNSIGLGVSAISELEGCFYQNEKEIQDYSMKINNREFSFNYTHAKEYFEKIVARAIEQIMCFKKADLRELLSAMEADKANHLIQVIKKKFQEANILTLDNGIISIKSGRELDLRRVCYAIDCIL